MSRNIKCVISMTMAIILTLTLAACGCSIPQNAETCLACNGSGECSVCDGDGMLEYSSSMLLGPDRACSFCRKDPGVCRTCSGRGYVILDN